MTTTTTEALGHLQLAAQTAGLDLQPLEPGTSFNGEPTARFSMSLPAAPGKTLLLELGQDFDAADPRYAGELGTFFNETAQRLRNPRPDCFLTVLGLPLSFGKFAWPFHGSTSGADTFIVHGEIRLETGAEAILHAKVSGSLTQTFAEVLSALQQPFAETFIYNAVRKTLDQGQLELVKSGNRQPVPVTTRYYSAKQNRFVFNDTTAEDREKFLAGHVYWLSHVLGAGAPVWIADPRDAQYLNTDMEELRAAAKRLAGSGLVELSSGGDWAVATAALIGQREEFEAEVADALNFIKPSFNEDMRAGLTNM
ncbi:MAG TPA: hypothetical protein VKV02_13895 [Acidobacteriaceae bacterium]|nr:hypothetical protein [Acidobacteriaceae bacterium]